MAKPKNINVIGTVTQEGGKLFVTLTTGAKFDISEGMAKLNQATRHAIHHEGIYSTRGEDGKRIIKIFSKVGRTFLAFFKSRFFLKFVSVVIHILVLAFMLWLFLFSLAVTAQDRQVKYGELLSAIAIVESGGDKMAVNAKEQAFGLYQIRKGVITDVNEKVLRFEGFKHEDAFNPVLAKTIAIHYLTHYGKAYSKRTGQVADEEVLARIWNGGYSGYFRNKSATDGYWEKVKKQMRRND